MRNPSMPALLERLIDIPLLIAGVFCEPLLPVTCLRWHHISSMAIALGQY
jgi:hypothetical protein